MLTHTQVWTALDRLAARAGLSPSGLARKAGLDPTTFNKSKRITPDGRQRWPSTESVAKALGATGSTIDTFVSLIDGAGRAPANSIPLLGLAEAATAGHFDDAGLPAGKSWSETASPSVNDEHAYALEISGDLMEPVYREGDVIVVSPSQPVRRGDRAVLMTANGDVMVCQVKRKSTKTLDLKSLNPSRPDLTLDTSDVAWIARVVWVSQ
jgi:phage repressor protein C with HTH and peptisase S24 domain